MELKYDLYPIKNAVGAGEDRQYVRLVQQKPMNSLQLQEAIQQRCSLTKGDVAAVLSELHDQCVQAFCEGRRFYIPGIGYFSLSVGLEMSQDNAETKKATGREVKLNGINFRPEAEVLKEVERKISFVRTKNSKQSVQYTEEQMITMVKEYFRSNRYITCRTMRTQFGLTQYAAYRWLQQLCDKGVLVKDGTHRSTIYFLK